MIKYIVIGLLLLGAFALGIIVARDDLRDDALKQAKSALADKSSKKSGGRSKPKKEEKSSWFSWLSSSDESSSNADKPRERTAVDTPPRAEPPRMPELPDVQAPADYSYSPEERLPVSPAERGQIEQSEKTGKGFGDPDRLRRIEERKQERERILAMSPEERQAYREQKKAEREERRRQRQQRKIGPDQPGSIEDVLEKNP